MRARLGVNVDHVATVRQVRKARQPDPVEAALAAELAGADQITMHLREDRRHIQERDVEVARKMVKTELNLEIVPTQAMDAEQGRTCARSVQRHQRSTGFGTRLHAIRCAEPLLR